MARRMHWTKWVQRKTRPRQQKSRREVKFVDLFCGCGGLSLALTEACHRLDLRAQSVLGLDIMAEAEAVYLKNFKGASFLRSDITSYIDGELGDKPTQTEHDFKSLVGHVDILLAGPPCQGHQI